VQALVLGPVEVVDESANRVAVSPSVLRLLARMVVARGRVVSDDELIDSLWESPPSSARKTLHGYVHRLRQVIGSSNVIRVGSGYRLTAISTDLDDVERWRSEGRAAASHGQYQAAVELLSQARSSFRGRAVPDLVGVTAEAFQREAIELEICVIEEHVDYQLADGHGDSVIADLEALVTRDPTRERAWCQLVQALASVGRRTGALTTVGRARRALILELGVSVGPRLATLERQLLDIDTDEQIDAENDPAALVLLPPPLMPRSGEVALVGRSQEWELLERQYDSLTHPRSVVVDVLVGEAGVGKTRLAAEFARVAHYRGARVLFGRASDLTSAAYQSWTEALAECASASSLLASLTALHPTPQTAGTPAADRYDLFERLAKVVENLATDRPVVLVFDDLHWAAQPTLQALAHLMRRARPVRLLIIATVREPEFGGAEVLGMIGPVEGATIIPVGGLDLDGVREYLSVAGELPRAIEAQAGTLHQRTGGNTFLLGEMVRHPQPEGAEGPDRHFVPRSVRDAITARARRLPAPCFEVIQAAAVIGVEFDLDVLCGALGRPLPDLVDSLDAAVAAQLIVEVPTQRISYAFRHALIADAVLTTLSRAQRARLHEAIAVSFDQLRPERTLEVVGTLARHWLAGLDRNGRITGASYAELAGDMCVATFAYHDACLWYQRSVDVADADAVRDVRCRRELALARAATFAGDQTLARQAATSSWKSARSRDRSVEIAAALLFAGEPELNVVGDEPGHVMLQATLEAVGSEGGDGARLMARLGSALSYGERHAHAGDLAVAAMSAARESGDPAALSYAIRCRLRGWFEPAKVLERIALAEELTDLGVALNDPVTEAWGWRWQGVTRCDLGDAATIEFTLNRLDALGERLHLPNQQWGARIRLAALRVFQGRFVEANELIADAYERGARLDNRIAAAVTWTVSEILKWLAGSVVPPPLGWSEPTNRAFWHSAESLNLVPERADHFEFDISRMAEIFLVAVAVRSTPHLKAASAAYPYALRDAERVATIAPGTMMCGSMHLYAGILAEQALGIGPAIDHLREAVTSNERIGSPPFTALSLTELARMLGPTRSGDQAAAQARDIAAELSAPGLALHPRGQP
jgi:DNA-binding SARP family transcriptional activator